MRYLVQGVTRNESEYSKKYTVKRICEDMGIIRFTSGHYFQDCESCPSLYTKTGKRVAKYVTLIKQ